jgi:uncharacterized damage-inducible protein DinB
VRRAKAAKRGPAGTLGEGRARYQGARWWGLRCILVMTRRGRRDTLATSVGRGGLWLASALGHEGVSVMEYEYAQAVELLRRTPATLEALLRGLPDAWTRATEGPGTWSAYDIVGHLLEGEEHDWIVRARVILDHGEGHPFESFNRAAMLEKPAESSLDALLAAFERARARSIATLDALGITPERLDRRGTHPALGTVTLSQLLATWVAHDLNHIGQIVEVMARQYAEAVGPWIAYLNILTRPILTE